MEGITNIRRFPSSPSLTQMRDVDTQSCRAKWVEPENLFLTPARECHSKTEKTAAPNPLALSTQAQEESISLHSEATGFNDKTLEDRILLLQAVRPFIRRKKPQPLNTHLSRLIDSLINLADSRSPEIIRIHLPALEKLEYDIQDNFDIQTISCWHQYATLLFVLKQQLKLPDHSSHATQIGDYKIKLVDRETARYFSQSLEDLLQVRRFKFKMLAEKKFQDRHLENKTKICIESNFNASYNQMITALMGEALSSQRKAQCICHPPSRRLKMSEANTRNPGDTPYTKSLAEGGLSIKERSANTTPLRHTQLVLDKGNGHVIRLCGNHIYINGQHAGIIMQAPRPNELDFIISTILENKIRAVLDLTNEKGRALCSDKSRGRYDPVLEWQSLESGDKTDSFELEITEKDSVDWEGQSKRYRINCTTFNVLDKTNRSCLHTFTSINFANWPDGAGLHPKHMEILVDEVNTILGKYPPTREIGKPILINCFAGLGRSSSFAAASEIIKASKTIDTQSWEAGQLALNSILHLRLSRSGEAVQTFMQAYGLLQLEKLMHQDQMQSIAPEQETQPDRQ